VSGRGYALAENTLDAANRSRFISGWRFPLLAESREELGAGALPGSAGDERILEAATGLVTPIAIARLAEVLEGLLLAIPPIARFVVLAGRRPRQLRPAGDAGDATVVPVAEHTYASGGCLLSD